jgi:hypothetical protein
MGTEEGLKILNDILQEKRDAHYLKFGTHLEITDAEFYDVMRKELEAQWKELQLLLTVTASIFAIGAALPPEDATLGQKNNYKFFAKAIYKISDEITFYYSPTSFESITKGSILPSFNILARTFRMFGQVKKEFVEPDKAHAGKAIFSLIPVLSQFQTDILPHVAPELAKEWGIRVTAQSRGHQ